MWWFRIYHSATRCVVMCMYICEGRLSGGAARGAIAQPELRGVVVASKGTPYSPSPASIRGLVGAPQVRPSPFFLPFKVLHQQLTAFLSLSNADTATCGVFVSRPPVGDMRARWVRAASSNGGRPVHCVVDRRPVRTSCRRTQETYKENSNYRVASKHLLSTR